MKTILNLIKLSAFAILAIVVAYILSNSVGLNPYISSAIAFVGLAAFLHAMNVIRKQTGASFLTAAAAGNFDCGLLVEQVGMADLLWADNATRKNWVADVEIAKAILENQTAQLMPLRDPDKDFDLRVMWADACEIEATDECTDGCTFDGPELSGGCKTYTLTDCVETEFSVQMENYDTYYNDQMLIPKGLLKATITNDNLWAQKITAALDAGVGVNGFPAPYSVVGDTTQIPAASWTPRLMSYFAKLKIKNKFTNPFLVSADNMWADNWTAMMNSLNQNGQGDAAMMNSFKKYFDLVNIDAIVGTNSTYMIDQGAVAFVTKTRYDETPREIKGKDWAMVYRIPSRFLPGVWYDVLYTTQCKVKNGVNRWFHEFKVRNIGNLLFNPTGCDPTNNGLLKFDCI